MKALKTAGIRALAAMLVLALSASAFADISDVVLTIQASTGRSEGVLQITSSEGTWQGGNFFWSADHAMNIYGSAGEVVATVQPGTTLSLYADPQIAMGFSIQAGDNPVDFTLTSTPLSFATITNPIGRADAAFTVMEDLTMGATLTGRQPLGGAYRAYYNDDTATFAELIDPIHVDPGMTLAIGSDAHPGPGVYTPIGTPVSNMGAQIAFTLSEHAFASGSSNFEVIVPEPAALVLLAVAIGVLRRR